MTAPATPPPTGGAASPSGSADDLAIETQGLGRRFGDRLAVDALDLRVPAGAFYGFLGPNGAGKSTTINMLTGLLAPTTGRATVLGLDLASQPLEIKRRIGVVPDGLALFERLTGAEHLRFVGRMHGLPEDAAAARGGELLEVLGLSGDAGKLVGGYSHGMRKKLALALALIHAPRLLFLDEPFEGVDAVATRGLRELLGRLVTETGTTVFLTSHVLEIVERLCSHVAIIDRGRLVAQGPLEELRRQAGARKTLEDLFLAAVTGGGIDARGRLAWLSPDAGGTPAGAATGEPGARSPPGRR